MLTKETILLTQTTPRQLVLYYLGQVGFLLRYRNITVLIDGYLTDYVDRHFATAQVPWQRRYPAPIDPEALDFVDYVLCTHDHSDHTDPDTIKGILSVNQHAQFLGTHAVAEKLSEIGVPADRITALSNDETAVLDGDITVTNVPSAHEELHPDENGNFREGGFRIVFGTDINAISVYHAGDCCLYDGLEERVENTDVMILPVNGRDYYRRHEKDIIGNFDCTEAIMLANRCHADFLIPVHIDLYDVNALNPAIFVDTLEKINPEQKYHLFRPGERMIYCK